MSELIILDPGDAPMAGDTWQAWDIYFRKVWEHNRAIERAADAAERAALRETQVSERAEDKAERATDRAARPAEQASREKHAQAQGDTALAMQALVAAQLATVDALKTPLPEGAPGGSNAAIVRGLLAAGMPINQALELLRQFRTIYPSSSTGAPK